MKPILVTGASGLFGGEVARQLAAAGMPLRLYLRDARRAPQLDTDVEIVTGDYLDKSGLAAAMSGIEKMFLASYDSPEAVDHQACVLDVALQSGVQHIVRLSSDGTETNADLPIFRWHRQCDRQLEATGIAYTLLQPVWVMQNFESFVADDCLRLPSADGRIGLVDHRDVAAVGVRALTEAGHENRAYLLASESLSHAQVAQILSDAIGRSIRYQDIDPQTYRCELEAAGWSADAIETMLGLFAEIRAGRNDDRDATDTLQPLLGRPGIRFREYARDFASHY